MAKIRRRSKSLPVAQYDRFTGGLNTYMSAAKISDNESPNLQNIEFTENGIPSKRRGTDLYGTEGYSGTSARVSGLGSFYKSDGTRQHLAVRAKTGEDIFLYRFSGSDWTVADSDIAFADANVNFVQCQDAMYMHDGSSLMFKWDGSNLTQPSNGVTGCKFGIYYAGRNMAAGKSTAPSRLYMSSTKSADNFTGKTGTATAGAASTLTDSGQSWTTNEFAGLVIKITAGTGAGQERTITGNTATVITVSVAWTTNPDTTSQYSIEGGDTIDIAKNDGQKITGLAKFEEKLIIFKERSIYELTFDTNGFPTVQLVTGTAGCVSHRSIENVENDIFYLSHDGVRTFGYVPNITAVRTNLLSAKIDNEIANINSTYYENCAAIFHENMYILAFPQGSSTTNNRMIVFQTLYGLWTVWTGLNANCLNEFVGSDNRESLYYGGADVDQTYKMLVSNYTDGTSTAIEAHWYSKQFDLGAFDIRKRYAFVDLQFRAITGTVSIDVILDGSSTTKSVSLTSTFSSDDGYRSGYEYRETRTYRQSYGSTASTVAIDDVRRIKINKNARNIQIKVYNSAANENFTLMGIALGYRARSPYSFDSTKVIY